LSNTNTTVLYVFICNYLRFVDHCLLFFFWQLGCLSFLDLRILITSLLSSNSSRTWGLRTILKHLISL
jgi:hypothetical protein